jgi:hypothetical protein
MALTLAEANRIIQAAITKAQEMNIKVSAAVCDAGGRLMAFNRMDGAIWGSVYGSQGKAIASAAFGRASGELRGRRVPIIQGIAAAEGGHDPEHGRGADHQERRGRRRVRQAGDLSSWDGADVGEGGGREALGASRASDFRYAENSRKPAGCSCPCVFHA